MLTTWGFILFVLCHVSSARVPAVEPEFLDMLRSTGQHEAFAKLLGLKDVSLVHPLQGRSEEENLEIFTNVSPLGDILLTPEQEEQARQGINFGRYSGSKWPNNQIPYQIRSSDFTRSERSRITSAIQAWNDRMNLKLVPRNRERDYVMVFSGSGCYSNLGKVGGQQPLSLQSGTSCSSTGTVQHEFMHAAGMMHEHCRPDRDDYLSVLWDNIPEDWHSQYEAGDSATFDVLGAYDFESVMHYPMRSPSGKNAFDVHDKSADISKMGQRNGPTTIDVEKMNKLYP